MLNVNINCLNFKDLPNIEIILKARKSYKEKSLIEEKIVLKPEDYIIEGKKIKKKIESNENKRNLFDVFDADLECGPAFMPIDVPAPRGPIFVFGEFFLRRFYTVFDRDENIIGLSVANHDPISKTDELNIYTPYDTPTANYESNISLEANPSLPDILKNFNQNQQTDENLLNKFVFNQ
jgi:hypothetical protein